MGNVTLKSVTTINSEGVGFEFSGLRNFNAKWFSWAAICKAILHREDEVEISEDCEMPMQISAYGVVAVKQASDSEDDREGIWFSAADLAVLQRLPAGTELYVKL
jgi:hypothetical protein